MNTHTTPSSLDQALDEALAAQSHPTPTPSSKPTGAELSSLVSLAGDLARLPKAPGPTAAFTQALASRLAQASAAAESEPDAALAARLDIALVDGRRTDLPPELAQLLTLADGLQRLPTVPAPAEAFKVALALRLNALPSSTSAAPDATLSAQPTQGLLQALDQGLEAMATGHQDPRAVLLAACEHDPRAAAELAPLLELASGLRSLPSAPLPMAAFRVRLAKALRQAPWPRSLPRPLSAAPWSWLAAMWRNTAVMATAMATLLLFLGRDHLPSMTDTQPEVRSGEASRSASTGPAAAPQAIPRLSNRSAGLQRPDGWLRVSLPRPTVADAPLTVARADTAPAALTGIAYRPSVPVAPPAVVPDANAAPVADPVQDASAAERRSADDDKSEDRDRRNAVRPAPSAAPTELPVVAPTQASPPQPAPTEPSVPQPTTVPQPTVPVIPANEPPHILGLTCTPDQVEEAGSAECRVDVEDDGGLSGLSFEWILQGVGPELSDPRASTVTFTASGNGGGLGWQGQFVLVIIVRDAQGLETQGKTQVTITPAQP